jgi:hypothetical protein
MINKNLRAKLKRVLAEDGTVLFIGSGVSVWSGLPGWGQLLDEMANYVEQRGGDASNIRHYKTSQPLLAADFGCAALQSDDFKTFIQLVCKKDVAKPNIIHQLLIDLGVSCYITTNYDRLMEQALEKNGILRRFNVVTNREPAGCAGLLHLSRRNFVFKPHGDIEQIESIVLSKRQYNDLYENGTKFYTYRALETLLTTRDVVFVGFGLTDPDFMRIMGKIRNEFRTNLYTHYAIMPDISQTEKDYWAKNYGIQILNYATKETKNGRDHSALLELLDSLVTKSRNPARLAMATPSGKKRSITQKQRVALDRYTRYVMQQLWIPDGPVIPLKFRYHKYGRYYELDVEKVLSEDMQKFILTGNPGAGKTFFLKQYCVAQARRLHEWCEQNKTGTFPKIPIYIDLKNYSGKGSIKGLIESQFPTEVPIIKWIEEEKVFLLFDSFNEVEIKYLENNSCAQEIKRYSYNNDIIVATRFKNAIDLYLPEYRLEEVEEEYVVEYLEDQGRPVSIEEKEMVIRFLQNPLVFKLLAQDKIKINDNNIKPKSIYESYFKYLQYEIRQILGKEINFISIFDTFAYGMMEKGVEAFSLEAIEECLSGKVPELEAEKGRTVINWLIDIQQFLVPASLKNISFFHQTITEFLAAHFLADQFKKNPDILKEKLQYMRWNLILLFAIGFLSEKQAEEYIDILLQTDSLLAVQACSYVEQGANQIITKILEHLIKNLDVKNFEYQIELGELLNELPVKKMHQDLLRRLMEDKNIIGGAAAGCLLRACGDGVKNELLEEMFQNFDKDNPYNYLTEIGEALSEIISLEDYTAVVLRLGRMKVAPEEEKSSVSGFDILAQYLPLAQVVNIFQSVGRLNILQRQLLVDILKNEESQEGFDICVNLIKQGWEEAIFPLYLYVKYNRNICLDKIEEPFIQYLVPGLQKENNKWIIGLIHALYQRCPVFARGIRVRLKDSDGAVRLTYLYAIGKNRKKSFFSGYRNMLYYEELPDELIGAFDEVDWREEAEHIIEYLVYKNRLQDLSMFLDGSFDNTKLYYLSLTTFLTLVRAVDEIESNKIIDDYVWIKYAIGKFISKYVRNKDILNLYHISNEKIKRFFNFFTLNYMEDLKLDNFSKSEIGFMLEDIKHYSFEADIYYDNEILLGNITDEEFAVNILKPLLNTDNVCLRENIRLILEKAGERHLKRYIEQ